MDFGMAVDPASVASAFADFVVAGVVIGIVVLVLRLAVRAADG